MKLTGKKILLGITGGIAAYKSCSLVNVLLREGAVVKVVMTSSAKKFITPLTFQALTNSPVYDDMWNTVDANTVEHISLAQWPDIVIIAPATANIIAKMAVGMADDLLTTIVLATFPNIKIVVAPAMNTQMWTNLFVQKNVKILSDSMKFSFVDPRSGVLACREEGKGKIADTEDILKEVVRLIK